MSLDEFRAWMAYRKNYGSLNPILRQESGFALLATLVQYARGIKDVQMTDFIFNKKDDVMNDPEDFMNMFKAN